MMTSRHLLTIALVGIFVALSPHGMASRSEPMRAPVKVCSEKKAGTGSGNQTTPAADCTGATLLVVSYSGNSGTPGISDSGSNTWTGLTEQNASGTRNRMFYVSNPGGTLSSQTVTTTNSVGSICFMGFSGVSTSSPFDQQNGATSASASTLATGSITPTESGELLVTGATVGGNDGTILSSIDNGFTVEQAVGFLSGTHFGTGCGYLVHTSGAINPTQTFTGGAAPLMVTIASFKATATATSFVPAIINNPIRGGGVR